MFPLHIEQESRVTAQFISKKKKTHTHSICIKTNNFHLEIIVFIH